MNKELNLELEKSWLNILKDEFDKEYFYNIKKKIIEDTNNGFIIYPTSNLIFNALNTTSFDNVKVVILGQDPYHGFGQAHGLSFSVPNGVKQPPSLKNIFKELNKDLNIKFPSNGNLEKWSKQGVLLLNSILTVREGEPASHSKIGWELFTDSIIKKISEKKEGIIFLLWGKFAQSKEFLINNSKHYILKTSHPSPFSVNRGFLGCKHFSKTNFLLEKMGLDIIDWDIN